MISALSKEVRYIIDKLVDGYTGWDETVYGNYKETIKNILDFDKSVRYLPKKEYDMFEGDYHCDAAYADDDIEIDCLYFTDTPALTEETASALFGGTITTARHFTTIKLQMTYIGRDRNPREREIFIVSTRYTEYLYNSFKIRELITYIEQLLLSTVLNKMPASTRGLLPNGRSYKSINEYVELCIIYHLWTNYLESPEQCKLLYDKIEPLRLYESYEDFDEQNRKLIIK